MLTTGQTAPLFSLPTDTGAFNLADHHGKNVIVFFFPKADTSGCTKEAVAFSALKPEFEAANSLVIGISKDTPEKQAKFRAKHDLTCLLGADFNSDVCEQFGVCGLKNPCTAGPIWAFNGQHSSLMLMARSELSGQK